MLRVAKLIPISASSVFISMSETDPYFVCNPFLQNLEGKKKEENKIQYLMYLRKRDLRFF